MKLLLATLLLAVQLNATAQDIKETELVVTKNDYIAQIAIKKNNKLHVIKTKDDFAYLDVEKRFNFWDKEIILISQGTGGTACSALYFFLTVDKSGYRRSPDFGTCSDLPQVKQDGEKIVVILPNLNTKGKKTYEFSGDILKENGVALK